MSAVLYGKEPIGRAFVVISVRIPWSYERNIDRKSFFLVYY